MVPVAAVGEWNCSITANGALFVMTAGASRKPELYAGSWVVQGRYQPHVKHSLGEEPAPSGWMKPGVQGQNLHSVSALQGVGDKTTATMEKMLVSSVQVCFQTTGCLKISFLKLATSLDNNCSSLSLRAA